MSIKVDVLAQVRQVGQDIAAEFVSNLKGLSLSPSESAIVTFAAEKLATSVILGAGASDDVKASLTTHRDLALAALANIGVAKAIQAETAMKNAASSIIGKLLKAGLGIAASLTL